ncbi:MAG: glycosyltransferase [Planctomycetota bacterium]
MTQAPLVTVVLPVYNGAKHIAFAVESILAQSFKDFELLVVDDGSTDATHDVLYSFADERLRLIRHKTNLGLIPSLNEGIAEAQGALIARQDADDVSLPDRLTKQVAFLEDHPEVGLLGTFYAKIDSTGEILVKQSLPTTDAAIRQRMTTANCFCHGSVLVRKECLEKTGPYRDMAGPTEDYDLWLRLLEVTRGANLPEVLYHWCVSLAGILSRSDPEQAEASRAFIRRVAALRRKTGKDPLDIGNPEISAEYERVKKMRDASPPPTHNRARAILSLHIAEDLWRNGIAGRALRWTGRAIWADPLWPAPWRLGLGICCRSLLPKKNPEP